MRKALAVTGFLLFFLVPATGSAEKIYTADGKLARYLDLKDSSGNVTDTLKGISFDNCDGNIILRRRIKYEYRFYRINREKHKFTPLHKGNFTRARCFSDQLAAVKKKGKYGYMDRFGEIKIDLEFDFGRTFSNGMASVKKGDNWGYIDTSGELVVPLEYDLGSDRVVSFNFNDLGLAPVRTLDGKYGLVDRTGQLVFKPELEMLRRFSEGLASVKYEGKWGYLTAEGRFYIKPTLAEAGNFSEGMAAVKSGDKLGYINRKGRWIIDPRFEGASIFTSGLAGVYIEGKWGFIDQKGQIVIEPQFERVGQFAGDKCRVLKDGVVYFIDKEGNVVGE